MCFCKSHRNPVSGLGQPGLKAELSLVQLYVWLISTTELTGFCLEIVLLPSLYPRSI